MSLRDQLRASLALVEPKPLDITALNRADIAARSWDRVHINGDRSPPVDLPPARKGWRK